MRRLVALLGYGPPSPEYSVEIKRAMEVDATWTARIAVEEATNAERLERYRAQVRSQEAARDRDFAPAPGVTLDVVSRAEHGAQRFQAVTVAILRGTYPLQAKPGGENVRHLDAMREGKRP